MQVVEGAEASPALRAWLLEQLPRAEFAHQLSLRPDVVAEVLDDEGARRAALVGDVRLTTLSGARHFVAVTGVDATSLLWLAPVLERLLVADGAVELLGPDDHARVLADELAERTGGATELVMQQTLWSARAVRTPSDVPGRARVAGRGDRVLLATWLDDFSVEALGSEPQGAGAWVDQVAEAGDALWVWEHEGQPVSLVNVRRTTPVSSRIGPVWTPPSLRGNGYAAALTAHTTKRCLVDGDRRVVLLTDVQNPVSNRLYARVGYQQVAPHASWVVRLSRGAPV